MRLVPLDLEDVAARWKLLRPHIEQLAQLSNGRHSLNTIAQLIRKQDYKVWVVDDEEEKDPEKQHRATLLTEILEFPTGLRVGAIRGCAGKGKGRWRHLFPELHKYFEKYGCSVVEIHGRAGWEMDAKIAGYKRTGMTFESPVKTEALEEWGKKAEEVYKAFLTRSVHGDAMNGSNVSRETNSPQVGS